MLEKTRGIVLSTVKYGETSIIATIFTEQFGRQSYMINGIRSKKGKSQWSLFQPLTLLEMEVYHKSGRDLQRMKDLRLELAYTSIPFNIVKQSISLFLAEFLYRSVRVEDYENQLFQFVHSSLSAFDAMHEGVSNFHLWFLLRFSKYVGIFPENNFDNFNCWFNIKTSRFDHTKPHFPEGLTTDSSKIISLLFNVTLDGLANLKASGSVRNEILNILMNYYHLHFDSMGNIRSLDILKEIFR